MTSLNMFTKVLVLLVVLFGITTAATAFLAARMLDAHLTSQYESKGQAIANSIANASVEIILYRDPATIQATLDQYLAEERVEGVSYVFVTDASGDIISHTFAPGIPPQLLAMRSDTAEASVRQIDLDGLGRYIDISTPILASEIGTVHVGMDRDLIRRSIGAATVRQALVLGVIFAGSVVVAYVLMRKIAQPLNRLTASANQLAMAESLDSSGRLVESEFSADRRPHR